MTAKPKYGNRKTGGYDSRKEASRAAQLEMLQKAGTIRNLRYQVQFTLLPSQKGADGKSIERPVSYFADFVYEEPGAVSGVWHEVVEDCKGMRTTEYVIKRKMLLFFHHIQLRET
jgi:hypothetical protein